MKVAGAFEAAVSIAPAVPESERRINVCTAHFLFLIIVWDLSLGNGVTSSGWDSSFHLS